jgi:hypothetical protein
MQKEILMKYNYLFVNQNNGHEKTYHPFKSDAVINQDKVTEWLMKIPGAGRIGTCLNDLLYILDKENIPFEEFRCPCCEILIKTIKINKETDFRYWKTAWGVDWILLEGISGNY